MAGTIPTPIEILRAQLAALEAMYSALSSWHGAGKLLDLIHAKRDEIAAVSLSLTSEVLS